MKAVVLVGGEGTRLRPLTYTTPKPLLPIANQSFLERQLMWLEHHGVDEVVLSLGYLPDAFVEHFPNGRFRSLTLRYAVEHYPLGTAGGIKFAAEQAGIAERFVVCNGDVLTGLDLTALVRFHDENGAEATIHLARVEDPSAFGVVPRYTDGEVKAFVEKPPRGSIPTDWINAGTYVLEPSVLTRIPPGLTASIERETFPRMLHERGHLYAMPSDDYWLDIGTPEKYLEANADLLRGALGLPPAPDARELAPGIWGHDVASLDAGAHVHGPVLVGARAEVATDATVAVSVLGPDASVAAGAFVERAVLLPGAIAKSGARVVDSIVGPRAVVEADAAALGCTIVGAGAHVDSGTTVVGGRIGASAPAS